MIKCRQILSLLSVGYSFEFSPTAIRAKFALSIDSCGNESSCTTYLEPSDIATFICSAKNVSASTKLKWFINGSKEITDYISEETYGNLNEEDSIELSSTVRIRYERPTSLTCQAVDLKRRNDYGRFAHIQLQTKGKSNLASNHTLVPTLSDNFDYYRVFYHYCSGSLTFTLF